MSISGGGAVDGISIELSSFKGELRSQTALAIITQKLQNTTQHKDISYHMCGDNLAVQNRYRDINTTKISHHGESSIDLLLKYKHTAMNLTITTHWVKSDQDDVTPWDNINGLLELKLPIDAMVNM